MKTELDAQDILDRLELRDLALAPAKAKTFTHRPHFTALISILSGVSILVLFAMQSPGFEIFFQNLFFPTIRQAREKKTRADILTIKRFLNLYREENGDYPGDFNEFMLKSFSFPSGKARLPVDGWGKGYLLLSEDNVYIIKSSGNDCIYYTKDDIDEKL